ncbi:MAG: F0F1 ATP synthase subunit epsilon [Eubacteriales bacterium]|jgi:F0F1-type ATP synthase epsilon subunit
MDSLKLIVLSPEGVKLEENASSVSLLAPDGRFGVREGCLPIKAVLAGGDIRYTKNGKENTFNIPGGIAEIKDNTITVLVG